jgi:hypothetical protein
MVHTRFDTRSVGYEDFIQSGGGLEGIGNIAEGTTDYTYFKGSPHFQRGYGHQSGAGVGDVLRGLWRFFLPLIRRIGTTVSEEALNTGQRVLEKVTHGEPVKAAIVSEGKKGIDSVLDKGGFPKQFGTGKRTIKGRRRERKIIPSHKTLIGRTITKPVLNSKKRLRSDAFGLY